MPDNLLYNIISVMFSVAIGYLIVKKLLFTAVKYNFINFDFTVAAPLPKIAMIILIGLAAIAIIAMLVAIANAFKAK